MNPEIEEKSGPPPTESWVRALEKHDDAGWVASGPSAGPARRKRQRAPALRNAVIRVTRRYGVSSARVFDAWLDPEVAGQWLFATALRPLARVEIDARVQGSFCFVDRRYGAIAEYTGKYVEILPHRRLVFTLSTQEHPQVTTRVRVEIAPRSKGCEMTVIHENVPREHAENMEGRWTGILYGLGMTLDRPSTGFHHDQE